MDKQINEQLLRLPGQSLDERINVIFDEKIMPYFVSIFFIIILIVYEWIHWFWTIQSRPVIFTIIGALFVIFFILRITRNISNIRNLAKGRDGERVVGQILEGLRSDGAVVFHDVLGTGFNIDHVIVSPKGIFIIETKAWSKKRGGDVKFDGDHLVINGSKPERDPVQQGFSAAHWLEQIIKESTGKEFQVWPVIVFPGLFVDLESSKLAQKKGFWVLNPKVLSVFIKNKPTILDTEDLHMVAFHLSRYIKAIYKR